MVISVNKLIENNEYLETNGYSPGSTGLIKTIENFIDNRTGTDSIGKTSGYIYETSLAALDAAYAGYAGIGIKGLRTRNIIVENDPPEDNNYRFVSTIGNPSQPNFWENGGDTYGRDTNFKTGFLVELGNTSGIIKKVTDYKNKLTSIQSVLSGIIKIEEFPDNPINKAFKDYCDDDISSDYFKNEKESVDGLLVNVSDYLEELNTYFTYFDSVLGSDPIFNTKVNGLNTTLNNLLTAIQERVNTNYIVNISGTEPVFSDFFSILKKWRLFWIKERIFKFSGSLTKKKAIVKAKDNLLLELGSKESTLGIISANPDEWIKAPNIYATYYNPIVEEELVPESLDEFTYITTKRISFIRSSYEHTTKYFVFRKKLEDIPAGDFNNDIENNWADSTKLAKTHIKEIYDDTENISAENTNYVYRIQAIDDTDVGSKSLQSDLLGKRIEVSKKSANELNSEEEISGFIFVDGKVNYIKEAIEDSTGKFILSLENNLTSTTIEEINLITCIAPNYFIGKE